MVKSTIPEPLRQQLSRAGKACLKKHGKDFYRRIAQKAWIARLEKAQKKAREMPAVTEASVR